MKSVRFWTATPSSNASMLEVTFFTVSLNRLSTHLSSMGRFSGRTGVPKSSGRFIRIYLEAFQSLLAKLRIASQRSGKKRMSFPGELPVMMLKRSASAP